MHKFKNLTFKFNIMVEEEKKVIVKLPKLNIWMISTLVLMIAVGLLFYRGTGITGRIVGALAPEQAGQKAIDYLNKLGYPCTLVSVKEFGGDPNLYEVITSLQGQQAPVYITKDGKYLFLSQPADTSQEIPKQPSEKEEIRTIGNFLVSEDPVCTENGKLIVYLFGRSGCPHCLWLHPIIINVTGEFKDLIVLHDNMDLDIDREVYDKYGTGYIPLTVLGCKYYRTGTNHERENDIKSESDEITALICKLTENKPNNVCDKVQDLIKQIGTNSTTSTSSSSSSGC